MYPETNEYMENSPPIATPSQPVVTMASIAYSVASSILQNFTNVVSDLGVTGVRGHPASTFSGESQDFITMIITGVSKDDFIVRGHFRKMLARLRGGRINYGINVLDRTSFDDRITLCVHDRDTGKSEVPGREVHLLFADVSHISRTGIAYVTEGFGQYSELIKRLVKGLGGQTKGNTFSINYSIDGIEQSPLSTSRVDTYTFEEVFAFQGWSRLSYGVKNPDQLMEVIVSSKLLTLEAFGLDEALNNTETSRSAPLIAMQNKIQQKSRAGCTFIPRFLSFDQAPFKEVLTQLGMRKELEENLSRVGKQMTEQRLLSETQEELGVDDATFTKLIEHFKALPHKRGVQFALLSSNRVSLAAKLSNLLPLIA